MSNILDKFITFFKKYNHKMLIVFCVFFIAINFYNGNHTHAYGWVGILLLNILLYVFTKKDEDH